MITKKCSKCKEIKDISNFYKNPQCGTKDGFNSWCKRCHNKKSTQNYYRYKKENPEKLRQNANKWRKNNLERAKELAKKSWKNRRLKVLRYYSNGIPKCVCCGEDKYEFLSIDHIDGNGLKLSRELGYGRGGLMNWIIRNNYPKGFQILCHNCNFAKGHYGQCPHKKLIKQKYE